MGKINIQLHQLRDTDTRCDLEIFSRKIDRSLKNKNRNPLDTVISVLKPE